MLRCMDCGKTVAEKDGVLYEHYGGFRCRLCDTKSNLEAVINGLRELGRNDLAAEVEIVLRKLEERGGKRGEEKCRYTGTTSR